MVNPTPMQVEAAYDYLYIHGPREVAGLRNEQKEIKKEVAYGKKEIAKRQAELAILATKIESNEKRINCLAWPYRAISFCAEKIAEFAVIIFSAIGTFFAKLFCCTYCKAESTPSTLSQINSETPKFEDSPTMIKA